MANGWRKIYEFKMKNFISLILLLLITRVLFMLVENGLNCMTMVRAQWKQGNYKTASELFQKHCSLNQMIFRE